MASMSQYAAMENAKSTVSVGRGVQTPVVLEERDRATVQGAVDRLDRLTSALGEYLDRLEDRMQPALSPQPPGQASDARGPVGDCQVAAGLNDIGDRIELLISAVAAMTDRVRL